MADEDGDLDRDDEREDEEQEVVVDADQRDSEGSEAAEPDKEGADADEENRAEEAVEEEEEEITEPDNQDAIVALKDIGARVDCNDKGRVWRVFFYDKHGDDALAQVHGLPALKEVWILGTKITAQMKDRFVDQFPKVTVYYG